jgi:hypothetical protein
MGEDCISLSSSQGGSKCKGTSYLVVSPMSCGQWPHSQDIELTGGKGWCMLNCSVLLVSLEDVHPVAEEYSQVILENVGASFYQGAKRVKSVSFCLLRMFSPEHN